MLLFLCARETLGGQWTAPVVDAGLAAVRFPDDSLTIFGPSIRASLTNRHRWDESTVVAGAVASTDGASGSLNALHRHTFSMPGTLALDLGGELSSILSSNASVARSGQLSARLRIPLGGGEGWVRGTGDAGWRGSSGRTLHGHGVELGGAQSWPRVRMVEALRQQFGEANLYTGGAPSGVAPVRYVEGEVDFRFDGRAASLELSALARRDPDAVRAVESAYTATALLPLSEAHALTVSLTRQLPDFVRGAESVQSIAIGLRWNDRSLRSTSSERRPHLLATGSGATRRLELLAPGARRAEVMADFTGWVPRELIAVGPDHFALDVTLGSGTTHVLVRIDGGPWTPPANTPTVSDDFGGKVGLMVVP